MPEQRRANFSSFEREPFSRDPDVHLKKDKIQGPVSFLNPTRANFGITDPDSTKGGRTDRPDGSQLDQERTEDGTPLAPGVEYGWRSRDNRKGRHNIIIHRSAAEANGVKVPLATNNWRVVLHNLRLMVTYYPYWDVSWWVAQTFTWGSVVFVLNGFFYLLPLAYPWTTFPNEGTVGGGVTAFIGCMLYEAGVFFLMLETVNENRTGCFGWALREAIDHLGSESDSESPRAGTAKVVALVDKAPSCGHHHSHRGNLVGKGSNGKLQLRKRKPSASASPEASSTEEALHPDVSTIDPATGRTWVWLPSWHDLTTHYFHELGFLGNFILFISATIFGMIGICSLPGLSPAISPQALYGVFWAPDVLGSVGFIVSCAMLMVETQPNWYTPAPTLLGWHACFWNVAGSVGFLLSAVFGVCGEATTGGRSSMCYFQSDLHTTWGSMAFLIGSVILWYESISKYSIEIKDD